MADETKATVEAQDAGLRVAAYDYAKEHAGDLATGLLAAVLVWFAIEAIKPLYKLLVARLGWGEDTGDVILKTAPYVIGVPISWMLNFAGHWQNLTGSSEQLDMASALVIGGLMTGGAAQLGYHLIHRFQVVKTLQIRWQRLMGVTPEDLKALRDTQAQRSLTIKQVEVDQQTRSGEHDTSDDQG